MPSSDPNQPLRGRVAFVTGGTRGIGLASALELTRLGSDVALLDVAEPNGVSGVVGYQLSSRGDLASAERQIQALGVRVIAIVADVRDAAAMERAVAPTSSELGGLDIVFACAGIFNVPGDNLDAFTALAWPSMIDVNVLGIIHTVRAALPGLRASPEMVDQLAKEGTALPIGMLEPIDIARAVGFLAGPGGRSMSRATIDLNVGRPARLTA